MLMVKKNHLQSYNEVLKFFKELEEDIKG